MNRIDAHQEFWKVNSARDRWDGGMMEYLSVPSSSLLHGGGLNFDELALVEQVTVGAHGVRRAEVEPRRICISGWCRSNWFWNDGVCKNSWGQVIDLE